MVVADYFQTHTLAQNKRVIDDYIALLFHFWEHGVSDRAFKLPMNFGVTDDGRLILLDLGELYFEKEKAFQRVRARPWESVLISDEVLNDYHRGAMNRAMTLENVEMHWGRSLSDPKASSGPLIGAMPSPATLR